MIRTYFGNFISSIVINKTNISTFKRFIISDNTSDADIIRLEALKKENVEHSSLLEVFNVPEFTRILVCGRFYFIRSI